MKRLMSLILLVILLPTPVFGLAYDAVSFSDDGVLVTVSIDANERWTAPFSEVVNISVGVVPEASSVISVNITRIDVVVNCRESDGSDYILIATDGEAGAPLATGNSYSNYSTELVLSGSDTGLNCYFAVVIQGSYSNGTHHEFFQAISPENLVGPFVVGASLASPIVYVGLLMIAITGVIFVAGMYGVKSSRKRSRRRTLED